MQDKYRIPFPEITTKLKLFTLCSVSVFILAHMNNCALQNNQQIKLYIYIYKFYYRLLLPNVYLHKNKINTIIQNCLM